MAGRLTDLDVDVLQQLAKEGRLTDLDVDVLQALAKSGRLVDLDVDVLQEDPTTFDTLSITSGWGFIPIGLVAATDTYTDTYEDAY